jgi:UDP-N-acetylmuramate dehydrogenase
MAPHTTFKVGGPADLYIRPVSEQELLQTLTVLREGGIPWFVLGGGANILVADEGIRGAVIATEGLNTLRREGDLVSIGSGMEMSLAAWLTGSEGLGGLHGFYAMPGTVGGAMWMNARCYGCSLSDTLRRARLLSPEGLIRTAVFTPADFDYKQSPFQKGRDIILEGSFLLTPGDRETFNEEMRRCEEDRRNKGHFMAPSAGSAFKNNRSFGKPSGQIIDEAGLKGLVHGGARVSPSHGNIVQNHQGATAREIRELLEMVEERVYSLTGFKLEREVLYVGDWPEGGNNGSQGTT